ncbi:MAG: hypothetical protein V1789_00790 [PVC group bacterium]
MTDRSRYSTTMAGESPRVHVIRQGSEGPGPVIYWMQRDQRARGRRGPTESPLTTGPAAYILPPP